MEKSSFTATVGKFFCNFNRKEETKKCQNEQAIKSVDADDFEQFLLREYECPVCINYAVPPIFMCICSHIICVTCWQKCPTCPTCRTEKSPSRAFALEKIYPLLTFPCKYNSCPFVGKDGTTVEHQLNCDYMPLRCPFDENFNCHWLGPYREAKDHLAKHHSDNVYFDSSATLVNRRFRESVENRFLMVFYAYGNIFRFKWEYSLLKPVVKFTIRNLGCRQSDISNYTYEVKFTNNSLRRLKSIRMAGDIPSIADNETREFNALLSELLYTFSKKNNTLTYTVSIHRNPPKDHV
ncbi:uncharacterized protein LOC143202649 [Rhynchophorus ferrugineus]